MRLRWLLTRTEGKRGAADLSPSSSYWRMLGALVLGIVLARWSWVLFAPHATAVAVVPEHGATVDAGRLFGVAVSSVAASGGGGAGGTASSNLRLVGVFAGRVGQPGFAVLKLDDKHQAGIVVGQNVVPGTKLLEAHPDYVLLEHAGVQQRVNLEVKAAGVSGAGAAPAAGAAPVATGNEMNKKTE
jgi:hypothetical protein